MREVLPGVEVLPRPEGGVVIVRYIYFVLSLVVWLFMMAGAGWVLGLL